MKKKDQILLEQAYEAVLKPDANNTLQGKKTPEEHNHRRIVLEIGRKLESRGLKYWREGSVRLEDGGWIELFSHANGEIVVMIEFGPDSSFKRGLFADEPKAAKTLMYNTPRSFEEASKLLKLPPVILGPEDGGMQEIIQQVEMSTIK